MDPGYRPLGTFRHTKDAATNGCRFCTMFCKRLIEETPNMSLEASAWVTPLLESGDQGLFELHIGDLTHAFHDRWQLHCRILDASHILKKMDGEERPHLPMRTSRQPDSATCTSFMRYWFQQCHEQHGKCHAFRCHRQPELTPLPTRVLDVGSPAKDPVPLISDGRCGRCAALSHCWGTCERLTLTKSNIGSLQAGIPMFDLPATFRDAIKITRSLGLRYLWIDCYGIAQDDPEDWRRESARMTAVYANSTITIATLSSVDSQAGILKERQTTYWEARSPQHGTVSLGHESVDLDWKLYHSRLDRRGWCMQERMLAPAVLYFSDEQIFWECAEVNASETYPFVTPTPRLHMDRGPTHILFSLEDKHSSRPCLVWYQLVAEYSWKLLTISTDRLVAISGLASRFAATLGAQYAYGLCLHDLHRGLLWHRGLCRGWTEEPAVGFSYTYDQFIPDGECLGAVLAPSWSWGSLTGSISFEWACRELPCQNRIKSTSDAIFQLHGFEESTSGCSNHSGEMSQPETQLSWLNNTACLPMSGHILEGSCRVRDVNVNDWLERAGHITLFTPTSYSQLSSHTHRQTMSCLIDLKSDWSTDSCYCVRISTWDSGPPSGPQTRRPHLRRPIVLAFYLILMETDCALCKGQDIALGSPCGHDKKSSRRIGMGGELVDTVDEVFGNTPRQEFFLC